MELQLKLIGVLLIVLALIHIGLPRYFDWKNNLVSLSPFNKQVFKVHTFFIALVVFLMGVLCISSADLLINTELGRRVSLGLGIFWATRMFFQFFVYSKDLWRGKTFETIIHIIFSCLWIYFSVIFLKVYLLSF